MNRLVRWLTILTVTVALGVAVVDTPPTASAQAFDCTGLE